MELLTPELAKILVQCDRGKLLEVGDPEETVMLMFTRKLGLRVRIVHELLGHEPDLARMEKKVNIFERNTEKVLGAVLGSFTMFQVGFSKRFTGESQCLR